MILDHVDLVSFLFLVSTTPGSCTLFAFFLGRYLTPDRRGHSLHNVWLWVSVFITIAVGGSFSDDFWTRDWSMSTTECRSHFIVLFITVVFGFPLGSWTIWTQVRGYDSSARDRLHVTEWVKKRLYFIFILFYLIDPLHIYYAFQFCVLIRFLCVWLVSLHLYGFLILFLWLFVFCLLILFCSGLFMFVSFYFVILYLPICFLSRCR